MKKLSLLLTSMFLISCGQNPSTFTKVSLAARYYQSPTQYDFRLAREFNDLVEDDDSFIVYIYSPTCSACVRFAPHIENFVTNNEIHIYKLNVSLLEYTSLDSVVKYIPFTLVYDKGEIAYQVEDPQIYKDESSFTNWVFARVKTYLEISSDNSNSTVLN